MAPMPYTQVFTIRQGETKPITADFTTEFPTGAAFAVSGNSVAAVEHYGQTAAASVLVSTTPTVSGTVATAEVRNVNLDDRYDVTFTVTLNDATPSVLTKKILIIGVDSL